MATVEGFLVTGVSEILKKLLGVITNVILNEISPFWTVKRDLKNLENKLEVILAVISDAENRQVTENSVNLWLKRLRHVAYDAEDMIGEFAYELMRRDQVHNYLLSLSFDYNMASQIKTINTTLDALTKDMGTYGLNQRSSTTSGTRDHPQPDIRIKSHSYIDESEINVEREKDISNIVDSLIQSRDDEKISVISIVGMGGIGKTTLAQKIFRHETVTEHFNLKSWVYVSERDIVVDKVLKDIFDTITGQSTPDAPTTDVLVSRLRRELNGKKYLLVLDDFWDKDIRKWASLKSPLLVGAQGSKILVTTRSVEVASNVRGAIDPYELQQISNEGCWSIIKHRAFSPGGARKNSNMIDLGKYLASKCGGLPLAAQILGSLMHQHHQESDWVKIKEKPVMKILETGSRIKEILKLSYDHLSPNLKRCFSYCSIFPRGEILKRKTLVQLWTAEGFVPSPMEEEEGNKFFNILVNNSLLQTHSPKQHKKYKMHDLIHDLARSVSDDNEFLNLKVSEMDASSNKEVRRLGVVFDKKEFSTTFPEKLRTFLTLDAIGSWESNCVFSHKYLRILDLCRPAITNSPLSLAELKLLRYLKLSKCSLEVQNLNISALYNLQTLLLKNCSDLESLPNDIGALKNLTHLTVSRCPHFVELPKSICSLSNLRVLVLRRLELEGLPSDIGHLKKLKTLDLKGSSIKKLPDSISDCHDLKVLIVKDNIFLSELPKELGALKHLRVLDISSAMIRDLPDSIIELTKLTELYLGNSCQPPKYIGNLTNLRSLTWSYDTIGIMPGMDRLTSLETLQRYDVNGSHCAVGGGGIGDLGGLNLIGGDLMINYLKRVRGGGIEEAKRANLRKKSYITSLTLNWGHPSDIDVVNDVNENGHLDEDVLEGLRPHCNLNTLVINGYKGLKLPSWITNTSSSLPNLVKLELRNCNGIQQLQGLLGQLPQLKNLTLDHLKNLEEWIEEEGETIAAEESTRVSRHSSSCYFPMLVDLVIKFCPKLITFPTNFPCLVNLTTIGRVNPKVLNINNITSLDCLQVGDFSDIDGYKGLKLPSQITIDDDDVDVDENRHFDEDVLEGIQPHPNLMMGMDIDDDVDDDVDDDDDDDDENRHLDEDVLEGLQPHCKKRRMDIDDDDDDADDDGVDADVDDDDDDVDAADDDADVDAADDDADVDADVVNDVNENGHLDEDVLEGLRPHCNLNTLVINGYKGSKLPSWITNTSLSLPNLVELQLENCNRIQHLQGLGQLPHLKKLTLSNLENLKGLIEEEEVAIAAECTGISRHSSSCYFPMLVDLDIQYCPKLITFPTIFPCLEMLTTVGRVNPKVLNINMPSLEYLNIVDVPRLKFLPRHILQPRLRDLTIERCSNFQGFLPPLQETDLQVLKRMGTLNIQCLHPQSDSIQTVLSNISREYEWWENSDF